MSEPPGRTLLSQWVKTPTQPERPFNISSENPQPAEQSKYIDRKRSSQLWGDIFRKPEPAPKNNKEPLENSLPDTKPITNVRRERHFNPQNPFNSYVVTMKFPSHLNDLLIKRDSEQPKSSEYNNASTEEAVDHTKPSFARPSFIHVFKTRKESLQQIRSKAHPFFAKRNTSSALKSNTPFKSRLASSNKSAPWDVLHIRPARTWDHHARLPRRIRHKSPSHFEVYDSELPLMYIPESIHTPQRLLASSDQIMAMAKHGQSPSYEEENKHLIHHVGQEKPYDLGQFETRLWCDIYTPRNWQNHITPAAAKQTRDWLAKQFESRAKLPDHKLHRTRRKHTNYASNDGFVVDDDEPDEPLNDVLLVSGSTGSGKTSAVYAAAQSLDAFVFEVSAAVKRTGKEVSTVLDGISQNHAVHKAKNVVILVDDGDVIYENEAGGFWPTISKFATTSRRPVVITCTEPRLTALSGVVSEQIYLPRPNLVRVTDLAWLVALSEGHIIDRLRLARMVVAWQGDIRRVLTQLQFWCQMGIGGTPSSEEWVAKEYEMIENNASRVVSNGTWFPDAPKDAEELYPQPSSCTELQHLCMADASLESSIQGVSISSDLASMCDTFPMPTVDNRRPVPEESISNNGAVSMSEWAEPISIPYRGNEPALHHVYQMESSYGSSTHNIACDVAPFMRIMAASDYRRLLIMRQALSDLTDREARMTRRSWAASGIDSRQYLEMSQTNLDVVLKTGFPVNYLM